ncbi:MAG: VIT1/CCC1 transporter family protein [Patescibacteria group bacterium]|jgi:VIT1/CCC1 family predicted Fe2+/Mn2+ transporter
MTSSTEHRRQSASYIRNFIFGVEDSLVSTVGLLSGVAIAGVDRKTILLTGVVLIFVEAFSMAAGTFLSESSAEGYVKQKATPVGPSVRRGLVMFGSYFVSGFVPLFPYMVIVTERAFPLSISLSIVALFALGAWGGAVSKANILRSALRMAVIGGIAIGVGVGAGAIVNRIAG